jgi:hypothetical protein
MRIPLSLSLPIIVARERFLVDRIVSFFTDRCDSNAKEKDGV